MKWPQVRTVSANEKKRILGITVDGDICPACALKSISETNLVTCIDEPIARNNEDATLASRVEHVRTPRDNTPEKCSYCRSTCPLGDGLHFGLLYHVLFRPQLLQLVLFVDLRGRCLGISGQRHPLTDLVGQVPHAYHPFTSSCLLMRSHQIKSPRMSGCRHSLQAKCSRKLAMNQIYALYSGK